MLRENEFPTRERCDLSDPSEAFLWMFAALPGVKGGPLIMPVSYYREVSKRLWDLGARPVAEPTLEWVAPTASDPNWMTSPGRWVEAGTAPLPSEEESARQAAELMSSQQRDELRTVLEDGEPFPSTPAGLAASRLAPRQREVVLTVLRDRP